MSRHDLILPLGVGLEQTFDLNSVMKDLFLKPNDTAFAGGSLVEGIGNSYSDIDIHVVTDRLPLLEEIAFEEYYRVLSPSRSILKATDKGQDVFLIHSLVPGTQIKIDIEFRTYADFDKLITRLDEVFEYASRSPMLLTKEIDHREKAFLNRMYNAIPLANEPQLKTLCERVGKDNFLYLLYRWNASDFSILIDLIGAYENAEFDRACDLARERLIVEFRALLHLCGNTNFNRKWLLTYADRLNVPADILKRFRALFLVDGFDLVNEPETYIRATVDLVDELMFASEPFLTASDKLPSRDDVLAKIDESMEGQEDEYADLEAAYRKKAYGVRGTPTWDLFRKP